MCVHVSYILLLMVTIHAHGLVVLQDHFSFPPSLAKLNLPYPNNPSTCYPLYSKYSRARHCSTFSARLADEALMGLRHSKPSNKLQHRKEGPSGSGSDSEGGRDVVSYPPELLGFLETALGTKWLADTLLGRCRQVSASRAGVTGTLGTCQAQSAPCLHRACCQATGYSHSWILTLYLHPSLLPFFLQLQICQSRCTTCVPPRWQRLTTLSSRSTKRSSPVISVSLVVKTCQGLRLS